jgi:hypothetical protein
MLSALIPILLPAALPLIIPIAIFLGHRQATGAIIATGAGASGSLAVWWFGLGGMNSFYGYGASILPLSIALLFGGCLLGLAGWTLVLNATIHARNWRWTGLLIAIGYTWCVTLLFIIFHGLNPCWFGQPQFQTSGVFWQCPPPNPWVQLLAPVALLSTPVAVLVHGIRSRVPRVGTTPEAVVSLPLAVADEEDLDAEFEMNFERI